MWWQLFHLQTNKVLAGQECCQGWIVIEEVFLNFYLNWVKFSLGCGNLNDWVRQRQANTFLINISLFLFSHVRSHPKWHTHTVLRENCQHAAPLMYVCRCHVVSQWFNCTSTIAQHYICMKIGFSNHVRVSFKLLLCYHCGLHPCSSYYTVESSQFSHARDITSLL